MVKLTIDGIEIEVEKGTTVIQAAERLGIEIPRYCYHPGLKIVGVCRICLVEIERMGKLQVACYTPATDGMVVHTKSDKVLEARQAVMEFLLVNHPLDCPVCDQAGECWLQNFYMQHGLHDSQMFEDKIKKSKALPIGPNVMLDSERCILCSRCVRFCDDITQSHELGIFNRGDHAELLPYPGVELDNPYSGNTVDICPVGALTDRDFRFRTRVWYLSETPSICPGCSTGCNIYVHHNDKRRYKAESARISRLKPRYNADVNEWWMCDAGRYGFTHVDDATRILTPLQRQEERVTELSWESCLGSVSAALRTVIEKHGPDAVGAILSPKLTNEALFAGLRLFKRLSVKDIDFEVPSLHSGNEDDFLIKADKNPNTRGALAVGAGKKAVGGRSVKEMLKAATEGKLKALYICQHDLMLGFPAADVKAALAAVDLVIFQGSNENATSKTAHFILPGAAFVEEEGTFTNFAGRVQRIHQAVEPLGEARPAWWIFREMGKALGVSMPYFEAEDVFNALAASVDAFAQLNYGGIGEQGAEIEQKNRKKAGAKVA